LAQGSLCVMPRLLEPCTTLILRGVPSRQKLADLLAIFVELGFGPDSYDYVYMPLRDSCKGRVSNRGYMFVNFVSPALASAFRCAIHRHPLGRAETACDSVRCDVASAQGKPANLALLGAHPATSRITPVCFVRDGDAWHALAPGVGGP